METLRFGIIGMGWMGQLHAEVLHQLRSTRLAAIAEIDDARRQAMSARFGVQAYADYREMLADPEIDAVSICVRDLDHLAPVLAAAEAGKQIFLEKPIAATVEDSEAIVSAASRAGVKLMVGHLLRFDPKYRQMRDAVASGQLGDVIHLYARRNSPRTEGPARYRGELPLALHVTVHDLDIILWMLRPHKPVSVYAESVEKLLAPLGTEDSVFALIRFDTGAVAAVESSWVLPAGTPTKLDYQMEVVGTEGASYLSGGYSGLALVSGTGIEFPDNFHQPAVGNVRMGDLRAELEAFASAVLSGEEVPVDPRDSVDAVRLALAIIQSARSGQRVSLL
ncbi:Gfo/Idh/MocA family protein [Limnochorda pilosa]|uniref:Oxidoreductase n=1 Tax=Limnochorda pilosa TaxID=1555112 RepID=A0A0K2SM52_LIMPI|nr:Gfo/Idh/MocA family oxidoreductase [Limnochorda pilosa]BAS28180.1 oxidoreductase [Limnochorda pilosa]